MPISQFSGHALLATIVQTGECRNIANVEDMNEPALLDK
jgi:hypothetical protein